MKEHEVAILYPNGYKWWRQSCYISKPFVKEGIKCYRLVNSTPLPLFYGVKATESFISRKISISSFETFLGSFRPEVIHLHTLMGLSNTALKFFKEKGARIIYTSHDYFGICPKVNLINLNGGLCEGPLPERCAVCNNSYISSGGRSNRNFDILCDAINHLNKDEKNTIVLLQQVKNA